MKRTLIAAVTSLAIGMHASAEDRPTGTWTELHEFTRYEGAGYIEAGLMRGGDPNARDEQGHTPLHVTATASDDNTGGTRELLEAGSDPSATNVHGIQPLHYAALSSNPNIIHMLVLGGADLAATDDAGATALHYAAGTYRPRTVNWLLRAGADPKAEDAHGRTARDYILEGWKFEPYPGQTNPGAAAGAVAAAGAARGRPGLLASGLLLAFGALMSDGRREDARRRTLTHLVHAERPGWQPDDPVSFEPYDSQILTAAENGDVDGVRKLLDAGNRVDPHDERHVGALALAAAGQNDMVKFLLEAGAEIDRTTRNGRTALHRAVDKDHLESAEILLDAGANPGARDDSHNTPLHYAARDGRQDIVLMLLQRGAKVNALNTTHNTPLHLSAANGHPEPTKTLLDWGAKPELVNIHGHTALMLATHGAKRDKDRYESTIAILEKAAADE